MRIKISDFKLAEFILKTLAQERECSFLNLNVSFDEQNGKKHAEIINICKENLISFMLIKIFNYIFVLFTAKTNWNIINIILI